MEISTPGLRDHSTFYCEVSAKISIRSRQAIVVSNPFEATLMEFPAFIVTLRDYVREGLRADVHETDEQFLDTAAYWRNEYEKSREAEQQLRAQIRVLEQRLKSISSTLGEKTQSTGTSQRKRKRDDSTSKTRSGRRQTKLVKTTKATAAPQSNDVQPIQIDDGLPFGENDTQRNHVFQTLTRQQSLILY